MTAAYINLDDADIRALIVAHLAEKHGAICKAGDIRFYAGGDNNDRVSWLTAETSYVCKETPCAS